MSELLPITIPKCVLSRRGAQFLEKLTLPEWREVGRSLNAVDSCYKFLLGDWLNYGASQYGEMYEEACKETGLDYSTLVHYKSVCLSIEFGRRRPNLSYSHHREVSELQPKEQDNWLELADLGNWSVMTLRSKLRSEGKAKDNGDDGFACAQMLKELGDVIRKVNSKIEDIDVSKLDHDARKTWKEVLSEPARKLNEFCERL